MWAQIVNVILGLWLIVAPDALHLHGGAYEVARITGPIVVTFAAFAIRGVTRVVRYVNVLSGLWMLGTPWFFHYSATTAIVNSLAIGLALIGFSLVRGSIRSRTGGGWRGLLAAVRAQRAGAEPSHEPESQPVALGLPESATLVTGTPTGHSDRLRELLAMLKLRRGMAGPPRQRPGGA